MCYQEEQKLTTCQTISKALELAISANPARLLTAFIQLAYKFAAFFNFNLRIVQPTGDFASLTNHQGLLTVNGFTKQTQNIDSPCLEFPTDLTGRANQNLISC
jgi:hypothetical protein